MVALYNLSDLYETAVNGIHIYFFFGHPPKQHKLHRRTAKMDTGYLFSKFFLSIHALLKGAFLQYCTSKTAESIYSFTDGQFT